MFKLFKKKQPEVSVPILPTCETNKDGIQIQVTRVSHRPFYDSEWEVNVGITDDAGNRIHSLSTKITRDETETAIALEKEVRAFGQTISFDNIRSLDERAKIFYD